MKFDERTVTMKDGRTCVLRPAVPEDAEELLRFMRTIAGETPFLLRNPDEVRYTLEEEREILGRILEAPGTVMMAAEVDGSVAGNSSLSPAGDKRKIRHRCSLGIALYRGYWGLGIGRAMIGYLSELAVRMGYSQIDLEAVADNERARALYEKCGFIESGRRHHALKTDDGFLRDEVLMYKEL